MPCCFKALAAVVMVDVCWFLLHFLRCGQIFGCILILILDFHDTFRLETSLRGTDDYILLQFPFWNYNVVRI